MGEHMSSGLQLWLPEAYDPNEMANMTEAIQSDAQGLEPLLESAVIKSNDYDLEPLTEFKTGNEDLSIEQRNIAGGIGLLDCKGEIDY